MINMEAARSLLERRYVDGKEAEAMELELDEFGGFWFRGRYCPPIRGGDGTSDGDGAGTGDGTSADGSDGDGGDGEGAGTGNGNGGSKAPFATFPTSQALNDRLNRAKAGEM